jgi:hypothetical protein
MGHDLAPIFKDAFYILCFIVSDAVEEQPPVFQSPGSRNAKMANLQPMARFDLIWMVTMNLNVF